MSQDTNHTARLAGHALRNAHLRERALERARSAEPLSRLVVTIRDPALVSKYAFGTRTATFHICSRCGAVPLVTSEIAKHLYAVVNVNVLENVDPAWMRRGSANFEGEDIASRLARRKRNWIGDVRITETAVSSRATC